MDCTRQRRDPSLEQIKENDVAQTSRHVRVATTYGKGAPSRAHTIKRDVSEMGGLLAWTPRVLAVATPASHSCHPNCVCPKIFSTQAHIFIFLWKCVQRNHDEASSDGNT